MALFGNAGVQSTANVASQALTFSVAAPLNSIIVIQTSGGGGSGIVTSPGFSQIPSLSPLTTPSTTLIMDWLYKVAGGSEPTSYTFTPNSSGWIAIQGWIFSGRNTVAPFTAVNQNTVAQGSVNALSIPLNGVTAGAGDDILWCGGPGQESITNFVFTQPSGFTNALNNTGGTGGFVVSNMGAVNQNVSAGATGTLTGSLTWTGGNSSDGAGAVISLAAASGVIGTGLLSMAGASPVLGTGITPHTAKVRHFEREQARIANRCREAVRSIFLPTFRGLAHG